MSFTKRWRKLFVLITIGFLLISSLTIAFNVHFASVMGSGQNWLSGWAYRKSHVINGTGTTAGTNYQEEINVYYVNQTSGWNVTVESPMPTGLSDLPAVVSNNKIYTFGGYGTSSGDVKNYVYCYDPSTNSWTNPSNMTYATWGAAAALYNGIAYVFGGTAGSYDQAYNLTSNSWTILNSMPSSISTEGLMAITVGNYIYLFRVNSGYQYNPATDTYTSIAGPPMSGGTQWGTCAYVNVGGDDRIYIIGGGIPGTNTVYYYSIENNNWTLVNSTAPYAAYGTTRDDPVINGSIYYGYGNSAGSAFFYGSMYAYNPAANNWSQVLGTSNYPRDGPACGVVNGKLYVIGGREVEANPYGTNYTECWQPTVQNIVDAGQNVTTNGNCRTDFGDIRFTASNGITQLNYWMQSYTTAFVATFWVQVTDNLTAASSTIYIYYGNPSATTTSNGTATWLLFDDFEGANPLSNYNAETNIGGPGNGSFSIANFSGNHVLEYSGNNYRWFLYSRTFSSFQNMRILCMMMPSSSADYYCGLSFRELNSTTWYFVWLAYDHGGYAGSPSSITNRIDWIKRVNGNPNGGNDVDIQTTPTGNANNTWSNVEVDIAGSTCLAYLNGTNVINATDTAITGAGKVGFMGFSDTTEQDYWDNFCVGSYVSPEPVQGSWGAQEYAYTLTVLTVGSGSVAVNATAPYLYGEVVSLNATPTAGWSFTGWSGNLTGSANPGILTITGNMTVTATFTQNVVVAISPALTQMTPADVGTTFDVNVTIIGVVNLQGFDFNVTWDSTLLTLASVDFNTSLNNVWGSGNWQCAVNESGPGYYKLVALSTAGSFGSTQTTPLFTLTFTVETAQNNLVLQTPIHFDTHLLSNPQARPITHTATDGAYIITSWTPTLQMSPSSQTCRMYGENFTTQLGVTDALSLTDFKFELCYNTTLLTCASITWNAWGSGTATVDGINGVITGTTSGTATSGTQTLVTVQFTATYYHLWKDESKVSGWQNNQSGLIYIQWANLSYATGPDLSYVRGGTQNQINVGPDFTYTFSPIQGDVNNDGTVNILDLRTVAAFYDVKLGDSAWPTASTYDLNGDGIIDIYDLIYIGTNWGYTYP